MVVPIVGIVEQNLRMERNNNILVCNHNLIFAQKEEHISDKWRVSISVDIVALSMAEFKDMS